MNTKFGIVVTSGGGVEKWKDYERALGGLQRFG